MTEPVEPWRQWEALSRDRRIDMICAAVGERHAMDGNELRKSLSRRADVTTARNTTIYLSYRMVDGGSAMIARAFDTDVTHVLHALRRRRVPDNQAELMTLQNAIIGHLMAT